MTQLQALQISLKCLKLVPDMKRMSDIQIVPKKITIGLLASITFEVVNQSIFALGL